MHVHVVLNSIPGEALKSNGSTSKGINSDMERFACLLTGAPLKGKNYAPLRVAPILEKFQILGRRLLVCIVCLLLPREITLTGK